MGKQASSRGRQPPAPGFQPMQSRQLQTRPQTRPQALGNALATPDPFQVTAADITDPYARQRRAAEGVPSTSASDIQLRPPQVEQNPGPTRIDGGGFAMPSQSRPFQSQPNYGPTRLDGGGFAQPFQSEPNPAYGPTKLDGGGYAMPGVEQAPGAGRGIVWMEGQSNTGRGAPLRNIPGRQGLAGLPQAVGGSTTAGGPTFQTPGGGPRGPAPTTPFQNGQVGWEWDTAGRGWIPQMNQGAVNYWGDMRSYAPQGFNPDANDWISSVQKWAPVSYDEWAKGHGRGYVNPYSK
jgi:hypothetical protein